MEDISSILSFWKRTQMAPYVTFWHWLSFRRCSALGIPAGCLWSVPFRHRAVFRGMWCRSLSLIETLCLPPVLGLCQGSCCEQLRLGFCVVLKFWVFSNQHPASRLLNSMLNICLVFFFKTAKLFSRVTAPFSIPTNSAWGTQFPPSSSPLGAASNFYFSCCNR